MARQAVKVNPVHSLANVAMFHRKRPLGPHNQALVTLPGNEKDESVGKAIKDLTKRAKEIAYKVKLGNRFAKLYGSCYAEVKPEVKTEDPFEPTNPEDIKRLMDKAREFSIPRE